MAKKAWRSFEAARHFVHQLRLKNHEEWRAYCKSGKKPEDIPAVPGNAYGSDFTGYGDWLGTGFVANQNRQFRPFAEAREFVRKLRLKNLKEWQAYAKKGARPRDIPSLPSRTYGFEFKGWGDWLGTDSVHPRNRHYRSFAEAREFVCNLGMKNRSAWNRYCKTGDKPEDIPASPRQTYGSEFKDWGDWLGTEFVASRNRRYRPFAEARAFVRGLGLKNRGEWQAYANSGRKPGDIPASPRQTYGSEFKDWGDWLGTEFVASQNRRYRPFAEAREFVHQLRLRNHEAWRAYCQSGEKPEDIPASPWVTYRSQFRGYGDWLGVINQWKKGALLALLEDLKSNLDRLEEPELYVVLQQGGSLAHLRAALGGASPLQVLKNLKTNEGRGLGLVTK